MFLKPSTNLLQVITMPEGGMERGGTPMQQCLKSDFGVETGGGSRGGQTMYGGEEATPFPAMPDNQVANKSDSQPPSRWGRRYIGG